MKKERVVILFSSLLLATLLLSSLVAAQGPRLPFFGGSSSGGADDTPACDAWVNDDETITPKFMKESICNFYGVWLTGNLEDGSVGEIGKWFLLILIIILIWSVFNYVNFPPKGTRLLVSIIVGFLATLLITQDEIVAILTSYTALGVSVALFLPILILGFFTIAVASTSSPFGIYLQKILWLIYSVYLFIKAGFALIAKTILEEGGMITKADNPITHFFTGDLAYEQIGNSTILIVLLVVAIFAFIIMVLSNKPVVAWLAKEKRDAEKEAQKAMIDRSQTYDKLRADTMESQK